MAIITRACKESDKTLPTRYFSSRQEKAVAKLVKGKQTKNSGATMFGGKSDVAVDNIISIECKTKTTHSTSISIKKEWLEKLTRESLFDGKPYAALGFNFGPDEKNYFIIDEQTFEEFLDYLKNKLS